MIFRRTKRKNSKLPKAISWNAAFARARRQFQLCVRLTESNEEGYGTCVTCGRIKFYQHADGGHFIPVGRKTYSVALDENNCHFQCRNCNRYQEGNRLRYRDWMVKKYGEEFVEKLILKSKMISKIQTGDLIYWEKFYKQKNAELLKQKKLQYGYLHPRLI